MISLQTNHVLSFIQLNQLRDYFFGLETTVDVIAQKHQGIFGLQLNNSQQLAQPIITPMDVSYRYQPFHIIPCILPPSSNDSSSSISSSHSLSSSLPSLALDLP
jgi:hypothetical protein